MSDDADVNDPPSGRRADASGALGIDDPRALRSITVLAPHAPGEEPEARVFDRAKTTPDYNAAHRAQRAIRDAGFDILDTEIVDEPGGLPHATISVPLIDDVDADADRTDDHVEH